LPRSAQVREALVRLEDELLGPPAASIRADPPPTTIRDLVAAWGGEEGRGGWAERLIGSELAGLAHAAHAAAAVAAAAGGTNTEGGARAWRRVVAAAVERVAERRPQNLRTRVVRAEERAGG
jgi:hypothetical protein